MTGVQTCALPICLQQCNLFRNATRTKISALPSQPIIRQLENNTAQSNSIIHLCHFKVGAINWSLDFETSFGIILMIYAVFFFLVNRRVNMSKERNNLRKESETKNSIHLRRLKLILKGPLELMVKYKRLHRCFKPFSHYHYWCRPGHHYIRLNFQASLDPERELPLEKRQSQPTVLLRIHFTRTIKFHLSSLYSSFQFL